LWKPIRCAPSSPFEQIAQTSSGSIRKYSGGTHGVCVKWPIRTSGAGREHAGCQQQVVVLHITVAPSAASAAIGLAKARL